MTSTETTRIMRRPRLPLRHSQPVAVNRRPDHFHGPIVSRQELEMRRIWKEISCNKNT
jgi:hypothetical protein